jgi:hypothetical protein
MSSEGSSIAARVYDLAAGVLAVPTYVDGLACAGDDFTGNIQGPGDVFARGLGDVTGHGYTSTGIRAQPRAAADKRVNLEVAISHHCDYYVL